MTAECSEHLSYAGKACPDCGQPVDRYGNTEDAFVFCAFPDCGCDGARLCCAGEASPEATLGNVEGMWTGKTAKQRKAAIALSVRVHGEALLAGESDDEAGR
jgi:hypothetical protein